MPIVDDDLLEAIETFFANLRFPAGGEAFDSIQFGPSRANASITDNNCEYLIYMYACSSNLTNPKGITLDKLNLGPVQWYIKCQPSSMRRKRTSVCSTILVSLQSNAPPPPPLSVGTD